MNPMRYARPGDAESAIATVATEPGSAFIAGGTTVIDLMKDDTFMPSLLVDITALPMHAIGATPAGSVRLGALATMADVADHPAVKANFPVVSQALLQSASPQLRNMATIGGNILQRTRCAYFRDSSQPCNKRSPGEGCTAIGGFNRSHAVIGTSAHCICSHPSDFAIALLAVDATVHTRGPAGVRVIPFADLHVLPGDRPDRETILHPGELVESIELPASSHARASTYLKVRDRASYEFALVSVAAALDIRHGRILSSRVAIGGVAPKPWRAYNVENALTGMAATESTYRTAATLATNGMRGFGHNDFKIPLTRKAVERALQTAGALA